ncbi:MAG: hypothetical protein ABFS32_22530 [Bacteroidota bacterium]
MDLSSKCEFNISDPMIIHKPQNSIPQILFAIVLVVCVNGSSQNGIYKVSLSTTNIWQQINETTWYENDGFPTLMYVFYEDSAGNKKCIYQIGGSGLLCVARSYVEFSIIGSDSLFINGKYFVKEDDILKADGAAWRLYKDYAEVHGATGIVNIEFVKSEEFYVADLYSGLEK